MSKAFTKEDDDAGFTPPPGTSSASIPVGPFRLTTTGARRLAESTDAAVRDAIARAEVLAPQLEPERAALGVTVRVRGADGSTRDHRLVDAEEYALLGDGVSVRSPLGRALLGAQAGDVREVRAPRGNEELELVELIGERSR